MKDLNSLKLGESLVVSRRDFNTDVNEAIEYGREGRKALKARGLDERYPLFKNKQEIRTKSKEADLRKHHGKGWFDKMSDEQKKEYVQEHPHSKYAH